jgi:hypothetical protein
VAGEVLDPRDAGQLRHVQRARAHRDELRGELVATVRAHDPPRPLVVPREIGHLGVEQRVVVEVELLPDAPAVLEDLRRVRVLLGRHVTGLFEQRHVDEARGVALRARVAVPVPRAAEIARLLDDAHVFDAGFLQPGACDQAREAAADERDRDVVGFRLPLGDRRVRILEVVRQLALQLDVLGVAVGPQALVALRRVLLAERLLVDRRHP